VRSFHGRPVPVPLIGEADSAAAAVELFDSRLSERTIAVYLNTPNNPTGELLPRDWLQALAEWATRNGLWILADEVYEDYVYTGEHAYLRSLAPERTFSVHSFSKAYGMAGNRCGYLAGPSEFMAELRKVSTHTFYSAPTAAQLAGIRALEGAADDWLADAVDRYRELGCAAARRLGVPPPRGSTFLFLDVADHLDERGLAGFLEDCVDRGLFLAPGPSFGPYPTHVRLCFTSVEPARVGRGVDALARLLGR
jgi:N-succinyldiaminopimelate aminotransferase